MQRKEKMIGENKNERGESSKLWRGMGEGKKKLSLVLTCHGPFADLDKVTIERIIAQKKRKREPHFSTSYQSPFFQDGRK